MEATCTCTRFDADAQLRLEAMTWARQPRAAKLRRSLKRAVEAADRHPMVMTASMVVFALGATMLIPASAMANPILDIIGGLAGDLGTALSDFFGGLFINIATGILEGSMDMVHAIGGDQLITGSFDNLLGTSDQNFAYYAVKIADDTVRTCANTVLAVVIMIQLIKIASQIDRNGGTLPAVRDVFQLFVFMAIFILLVNNASELMRGLFDLVNAISVAINDLLGSKAAIDELEFLSDAGSDVAQGFFMMIVALVCFLLSLLAYILAKAMLYARAISIYILTMFSPLAFSFLGLDATRQWGVGYLKNFIAEALAGTVMLILLWCFPILVSSFMPDGNSVTLGDQTVFLVLNVCACCLTLILLLFRSGTIAQKILGGA